MNVFAIFIVIGNQMFNVMNIKKIVHRKEEKKLEIHWMQGNCLTLDEAEMNPVLEQLDAFVPRSLSIGTRVAGTSLKPLVPSTQELPIGDEGSTPVENSGSAGGDGDSDNGENGTDQNPTSDETKLEDSELVAAGIPEDLAILLHAGKVNTVDEVLTHPDLQQITDIGKGRKEKILRILKKE